ncbi:MAG: peptidoglycan LD-endopeptidase LytH [Actinomycetota bacterium]|jgi:murein DD-endopeptidase MepM/ murein hydrolase activator NlpD|nr:peptidoglycan LD-endopeptidase LytH [Actinomycetota bacterium]
MKHLVRTVLASLVAALIGMPASAAPYLSPVQDQRMTFPVARSSWYSVINFADDWHAPRMRKIDGKWRQVGLHEGNDIFAEPGTPIRAVAPGRVENIGWLFYSGWRVGIRGDDGRYWFYAHMSRFAPGLTAGDRVDTGTELGTVGNTGYGNRPGHHDEFTYHLHIGIQTASGTWVDPYPLMRKLYRAASGGGS